MANGARNGHTYPLARSLVSVSRGQDSTTVTDGTEAGRSRGRACALAGRKTRITGREGVTPTASVALAGLGATPLARGRHNAPHSRCTARYAAFGPGVAVVLLTDY